jgi:hypothetical protein
MIEHNCEREENDIKTKLRPFGKEITKSMFPQERRRERERDRAVALYQHQQERNITTAAVLSLFDFFLQYLLTN